MFCVSSKHQILPDIFRKLKLSIDTVTEVSRLVLIVDTIFTPEMLILFQVICFNFFPILVKKIQHLDDYILFLGCF